MIERPSQITSFDKSQVTNLKANLDALFNNASGIKYTDTIPTADTVGQNEVVIYDDGAGDKRLYMITGKKNLGYITLT
jgi:hypothetical protein